GRAADHDAGPGRLRRAGSVRGYPRRERSAGDADRSAFEPRRSGDLPEHSEIHRSAGSAALLAPRPLSFFARVPDAFEYTRHIYALLGKPGNFFRSLNIGSVAAGRYDHNTAPGL